MNKKYQIINLKTFDQIITALISYTPLLLPLFQKNLAMIALISTGLMLYSILLGILRGTFVNLIYSESPDKELNLHLFLKGMAIALLPLAIGFIYSVITLSVRWSVLLASLALALSCVQEIFRQILLKYNLDKKAISADAIWLTTSLVSTLLLNHYVESLLLVVLSSWILGVIFSLILQSQTIFSLYSSFSRIESQAAILDFFRLGFVSLISTTHGFLVNAILFWRSMESELGAYRGLLTFFLPISFIINYQQIVLLPLFSGRKNSKHEERQLSLISLFCFPILTWLSIFWILESFNSRNVSLGVLTGLIPLIVMFSNRSNLRLISLGQSNVLLKIRTVWLLSSLSLIVLVTLKQSLQLVLLCSLLIEVLYLLVSKFKVMKLSRYVSKYECNAH